MKYEKKQKAKNEKYEYEKKQKAKKSNMLFQGFFSPI